MEHFRKNRKDLNVVAASILFIAVMVLVSVAVDAWAGKPTQFSHIEELTVSSVTFSSGNTVTVVVENNGTMFSEITEVWINNEKHPFTANSTNGMIPPKDSTSFSLLYTYSNGTNYHIKIVSAKGKIHLLTATAP